MFDCTLMPERSWKTRVTGDVRGYSSPICSVLPGGRGRVTSLVWNAFHAELLTAIHNGRRPQMPSMRGHLHPPTTCRPPHAIAFVVLSLLHYPPLTLFQTRGIDLTNVNIVEINLLGGLPFVSSCSNPLNPVSLSDLLSRHVNKCHANEKPLPSTGVRKKGSVSASRATTSKQVCDQCVQANSSCDGCNPCGLSFLLLTFLLLIFQIQQNAFNADIAALL